MDTRDNANSTAASNATAATSTPPATPPAPDSPHEGVVKEWFNGFRNGPLSRNTELWNLVQDGLPDLIAALGKT